jgi:hypothetical protein
VACAAIDAHFEHLLLLVTIEAHVIVGGFNLSPAGHAKNHDGDLISRAYIQNGAFF